MGIRWRTRARPASSCSDPEIIGRFVYHCHAVDHEDKGMMGTVMVVS
jgi:hypothetical protein